MLLWPAAADTGEIIWASDALARVRVQLRDTQLSSAELAEAVIRAAATQGVAVAIRKLG